MTEPVRTRTYGWGDPALSATAAQTSAGIEVLQAMARGELPAPPVIATLGFVLDSVEAGRVEFSFEPAEYHYNPIGSVHGGVYATLLDSATGCAVHSMLPAGVGYTSLDLTVKFLRAITVDTGRVRCIGTVTHLGGRTA
ncbi:MAG: Thioesterase superfamily protein, partial [Modestobacter sp.]|nr:Thioesterase superfamily protein [Modestobacter sp.]